MPPHVDHQHVLGLEGLLFSRAILPSTHKLFLLPMDVVIVDVLQNDRTEKKTILTFFMFMKQKLVLP